MGEVRDDAASPLFVVGVGASAGGLEALESFFDHLPPTTGAAYVVVQHLSPEHRSLMAELLGKHTAMRVVRAEEAMPLEANVVYLIPPKQQLVVRRGQLRLIDKLPPPHINATIDVFFRSLAEDVGERAVCIVLSGSGSDGAAGARAVKGAGGAVMVQDPANARFASMPKAAQPIADFVGEAEALPQLLVEYLSRLPRDALDARLSDERAYRDILAQVDEVTHVDFGAYKQGTVLRRIERRMALLRIASMSEYVDYLTTHRDETVALQREALISVTKFFRDPEVFTAAVEAALPQLLEQVPDNGELRVWVAGCATGEEAYSWAMELSDRIRELGRRVGVRVFATDLDEDALAVGAAGRYALSAATDLGAERVARWFRVDGDALQVTRELRSLVLFARHNVAQDPPFSRMDLVSCRNLLIYLEPELQRSVLNILHFSLRPGRFLVLGTSESVGDLVDRFAALSPRHRVYQAVGRRAIGEVLPAVVRRRPDRPAAAADGRVGEAERYLHETFVPPAVLVSEAGQLVHSFGRVGDLLRVPPGVAHLNLFAMAPRPLSAVLTVAVARALRDGGPSGYPPVDAEIGGEVRSVSISARPVAGGGTDATLALVVFQIGSPLREQGEGVAAGGPAQLADLERELLTTRASMQSVVEELETSNEELQSTNEELLASNEELQSTNEELQSLNEELHTVNAEYQSKIEELMSLNHDMDNLLASTAVGTLFLGEGLTIRRCTPAAAKLLKMLPSDVGRPLTDLAFHSVDPLLAEDAGGVLRDHVVRENSIHLPDGRFMLRRALPYVVDGQPSGGVVVTYVDVSDARRAEARTQALLDSLTPSVAVMAPDGTITEVNAAWLRFSADNGGSEPRTGVGANYLAACDAASGDRVAAAVAGALREVLAGHRLAFTLDYPCRTPEGERWFELHVSPLSTGAQGAARGAVAVHLDITARRAGRG